MHKKICLLILDGWGIAPKSNFSAIEMAKTPFIENLLKEHPNARLYTHGENVGLPKGQMGNSEVGHMNIGAGRIVFQDLMRINKAIEEKSIIKNKILNNAIDYSIENNKKIHFLGLLSDGGIHSHIEHLFALLELTKLKKVNNVFVHAFTDGRDTDPKSGIKFVEMLENKIKKSNVKLASIIGRYYSMDRDKRWDRTKIAYDLLINGKGIKTKNFKNLIKKNYDAGITDEFINPMVKVDENDSPIGKINHGDIVIFFNFRNDRVRQITEVLSQNKNIEFNMNPLNLLCITMTKYDERFKNISVLFVKENLTDTLGEVLFKKSKTQLRIAETEKYPHVTFFFNGGNETPFPGEERIICPSPKVATYDMKPEMSAYEVKDKVIEKIKNQNSPDFICLNFANPDMVGHTGKIKAAVKACETVDKCLQEIVPVSIKNNYSLLIISDHGNCEKMKNDDGSPNTSHTQNPVPIILIDKDYKDIKDGVLANVAPTILKLMNIKKPSSMKEEALI
jgi:2,3-bisphosphoglycerate-independent phosphoglycerate mutase